MDKNVVTEELNIEKSKSNPENVDKRSSTFKKPILIGKVGRLPRKVVKVAINKQVAERSNAPLEISRITSYDTLLNNEISKSDDENDTAKSANDVIQHLPESQVNVQYKEPSWSGLPSSPSTDYVFEVLKSGTIVELINLMSKSFWVFGRSPTCDIILAHPTISRYHAVLQYRKKESEHNSAGFYIYDLNSTHGTLLNKGRLKARVYAPVKVGHMIKLGFSTRSFVLTGPEEDTEAESEFTVTELKQQKAEKLLQRELEEKEALLTQQKEEEERRKRDEERGVDWGLGEDADEETDLSENPYAQINNEELYVDDPKKTLRGFFEREGYDLEYDCTEQGFGQFLCKVELPVDDNNGRPMIAEVLHKGKKKEAVIQCALEACRILDRYGVLRQAVHESRKRKAKNWEQNDYYDSDDDTFLDRTGTIEKKREKRMQIKLPQRPETYQSLLEKEKEIGTKIADIQQKLSEAKGDCFRALQSAEEDSLDLFMKDLKQNNLDKQTVSKLKSELAALRTEHVRVVKLANIAKPADLPPLVVPESSKNIESSSGKKTLPLFGKRPKVKVKLPLKSNEAPSTSEIKEEAEQDEEEEELETQIVNSESTESKLESSPPDNQAIVSNKQKNLSAASNSDNNSKDSSIHVKVYHMINELDKLLAGKKFPAIFDSYINEAQSVLTNIKDVIDQEYQIESEKKTIMARNLKVKKHIDNLMINYKQEHLVRICKEFQRISEEIGNMSERQHAIYNKTRLLGMKIEIICTEIMSKLSEYEATCKNKNIKRGGSEEDDGNDKELTPEEIEKRRKRNQKRIQYRRDRAEIEKQKGYAEDAHKEDYNMWLPPQNQTGDGKTYLNEKYGY